MGCRTIYVPEDIWDALRERCCATRPYTDAKAVVMMRFADLVAAVEAANKKLNASATADGPSSGVTNTLPPQPSVSSEPIGKTDALDIEAPSPASSEEVVERIADVLGSHIANLGYPVGCGIAPHPETLLKIARAALSRFSGGKTE